MIALSPVQLIRAIVAGLVVILVAAAAYHFYRSGEDRVVRKLQENRLTSLVAVRKIDSAAISDAQAESKAIVEKQDEVAARVEVAKQEVKKYPVRVKPKQPKQTVAPGATPVEEKPNEVVREDRVGPDRIVLDDGAVCVLDHARDGGGRTFNCPAPGSDATGGTPAEVTLEQFIENDLKVVEMYHQLGIRHNALVDFVEKLQREQAERLNRRKPTDQ